jgi:exonuclease VII small subunit
VEIRTFLRNHRWLLALTILVPVVASGITYFLVRDSPARWRVQETLSLPTTVASGNAGTIEQWIASFREATKSASVVDDAAAKSKLSTAQVVKGLDIAQEGRSAFVRVRFVGPSASAGAAVLESSVPAALVLVARPQQQSLEAAKSATLAAEAESESAAGALAAHVQKTGVADPTERLATLRRARTDQSVELSEQRQTYPTRVAALQQTIAQLDAEIARLTDAGVEYQRLFSASTQARNDLSEAQIGVVALEQSIAELDDQIERLSPVATEFERLSDAAAQARDDLGEARREQTRIDQVLASVQTPLPIAEPVATKVPPGPAIRRSMVIAGGAAALLPLGALFVMVLARRRTLLADGSAHDKAGDVSRTAPLPRLPTAP